MQKMQPESNEDIIVGENKQSHISMDIIRETRKLIKGMNEKQRFEKAKQHLEDALAYKTPRPDAFTSELPWIFKVVYGIQTSKLWQNLLFILSYVLMYLVAIHETDQMHIRVGLEIAILVVMGLDILFQLYHKSFQILRMESRFQARFYVRVAVIILLILDEVIFAFVQSERPIRPFLVLRACLPVSYDTVTRKAFTALKASYQDILVYIFFYTIVIVCFAMVANQVIEIPEGVEFDDFTENYGDLGKMIFIIYVMSSYDAYPDNQLLAIQNSFWIYWFFILFIFLNVFLFVTIPTTILFNSFRETRSKIILIDEIKQQHSLILAFVSLGEENFNISQDKLIRFLLYVYKNKVRYVDYITEVCLKLDDNNNGEIQVNEFMQLCKILQSNSSMLPPSFHDWKAWVQFRIWLNQRFHLEELVQGVKWKVAMVIFIILTFINCLLSLYTEIKAFDIIDDLFMGIYCAEIVVKFLGLGPENFFKSKWNKVDFFLVLIGLFLELGPASAVPHNSDVLFKMTRIFRITTLIKLLTNEGQFSMQNSIYKKSKKVFSQTAIIIPIVIKFMPLYLISYYVLGILGMEIFYGTTEVAPEDSPYSMYNQFSNFHTFIGSQLIFVQVLVEAGWSMIAFDHAYRYGYFGFVMLYFVLCHIIIVIVLSSLLKGLAWEVYSNVHEEFNERIAKLERQLNKEAELKRKKEELDEIKAKIDEKTILSPDNLITKELFQNKIDLQLFKKLKIMYNKNQQFFTRKYNTVRSNLLSHFMSDRDIRIDEIQLEELSRNNRSDNFLAQFMENKNLEDFEELDEEDIEEDMQKVLSKIILNPRIKYCQAITYPEVIIQFLEKKIIVPFHDERKQGFNIEKDMIGNKSSIQFLVYELNVLMEIEKSERQQKTQIIENMVDEGVLSNQDAADLLTKKTSNKVEGFDVNWIMRKMFLSDTNEDLIKKFQIEYFSSVYGRSFKQINKVTIEPLLRLESRLMYCLKNTLRYRQIDVESFFTILSKVEDSISSKLLKNGSLFKFVYQIDSLSDIWFSIQLKQSKQIRIHFIKTGIWVYHKNMNSNQIHYANDLFKWDLNNHPDKMVCERYLKMLFGSFESLGFCLLDERKFFETNPMSYIYDLYSFYTNVDKLPRYKNHRLSISKIMLVILSKQQQRPQQQSLNCQLTEFKNEQQVYNQKKEQKVIFNFDESQNVTFKKLKKMQLMDYEKIVESQGLPFAYIINLLTQIKDILNTYQQNLLYQVQQVLNQQFDEIQV